MKLLPVYFPLGFDRKFLYEKLPLILVRRCRFLLDRLGWKRREFRCRRQFGLLPLFYEIKLASAHPFTEAGDCLNNGCFVVYVSSFNMTCFASLFFMLTITGAWRFAVVFSNGSCNVKMEYTAT